MTPAYERAKMETMAGPGVYSMPADVYHADPCPTPSLSSSGAKRLLSECPAKFKWDRDNPDQSDTPAKVFGRCFHELLLEKQMKSFVVEPDDQNNRTKIGKTWRAEQEEAGLTIVKKVDYEIALAMLQAINAHPFARAAFMNGTPEQSLFWQDEEFDIWRRCRLDWLPAAGGVIFTDYKSALSAHPDAVSKTMTNYGYAQQAAWYIDGVKALGLAENPAFVFVFQEKTPPYLVTVAQPSDAAVGWGRILNRKAMAIFAECLVKDEWPGYAQDIITVDLPGWAERQLEARHEAGEFQADRPQPTTQEQQAS